MFARPNATHDVPYKGTVMGFIVVPPQKFEIMPDGGINVAMNRDAFLSIVFAVLLGTFFKVLCHLKIHFGTYRHVFSKHNWHMLQYVE